MSTHIFLGCSLYFLFCFFKQKTAYEMRISDWSSDVCSSDLFKPSNSDIRSRRGLAKHLDRRAASGQPRRTTKSAAPVMHASQYLSAQNHETLDRKSVV